MVSWLFLVLKCSCMKQLLLSVVCLFGCYIYGQDSSVKLSVDKIVATVGDKIVLRSDIDNMAADERRRQTHLATDNCYFLREIMQYKALILQAQKDSIVVSDDEVEIELDQRIRYFIRLYGGKEVLEQVAGKNIYKIKEDNRLLIKEKKLAEAQQYSLTRYLSVTPAEVRKYYDAIPKDSLRFYEAKFELGQVVLYPRPEPEIEKYARNELESVRKRITDGEISFETAARVYSDDVQARTGGGLMEYNRNDKEIPGELLSAIFSLKEGKLSKVVKSKNGYYLVQLISRNGDDITVRYIVKKPGIAETALNKTVAAADTLRTKLMSGLMSFAEAVDRYSEDTQSKFTGGFITDLQGEPLLTLGQFEKDLALQMAELRPGQYSAPISFVDATGRKGVRILYFKRKTDPHVENLQDDYAEIAQRLLQEKKNKVLEQWFERSMSLYYVKVLGDYQNCHGVPLLKE